MHRFFLRFLVPTVHFVRERNGLRVHWGKKRLFGPKHVHTSLPFMLAHPCTLYFVLLIAS